MIEYGILRNDGTMQPVRFDLITTAQDHIKNFLYPRKEEMRLAYQAWLKDEEAQNDTNGPMWEWVRRGWKDFEWEVVVREVTPWRKYGRMLIDIPLPGRTAATPVRLMKSREEIESEVATPIISGFYLTQPIHEECWPGVWFCFGCYYSNVGPVCTHCGETIGASFDELVS